MSELDCWFPCGWLESARLFVNRKLDKGRLVVETNTGDVMTLGDFNIHRGEFDE